MADTASTETEEHVAECPRNVHPRMLTDVSAFCDSFSSESFGRLGMASMSFSATCSGQGGSTGSTGQAQGLHTIEPSQCRWMPGLTPPAA